MIYVMSDIHGDFRHFHKMLRNIRFTPSDQLYILGDIFDKNRENLCLYRFIRKEKNISLIKGNHEYLCERYMDGRISGKIWKACGGTYTKQEVDELSKKEKRELYEYLKDLPLYLTVNVENMEYFLTHSGFHADQYVQREDSKIDIQASVKKAAAWNQEAYLFSDDIHYIPASVQFDKNIIVGHFPTIYLPDHASSDIYYGDKYIDIDTGNDRREEGGRLACLRLDDRKAFYV